MNDLDVLDSINDCEEEYGSLVTNRDVKRRDVLRLVARGLVKSKGYVYVRAEDREREGFVLTDAGRAELERLKGRAK